MNHNFKPAKVAFAVLVFLIAPFVGSGQGLPSTQKSSLRASANVKVDGSAAEWGGKLQAYNNATDISYTISNDDQRLYLIVQATDHTIVNKILGGGILFTVSTSGKKNLKNAPSISYPVLGYQNRAWVNFKADPGEGVSADSVKHFWAFVSNRDNKLLTERAKFIRVSAIAGVDTLTAVFNQDGIKAVAKFDEQVYTYELSIELKRLGLDIRKSMPFLYNIKLPGVNMEDVFHASGYNTSIIGDGYVVSNGYREGYTDEYRKANQASLPFKVNLKVFTSATDFWAEYTLAAKK